MGYGIKITGFALSVLLLYTITAHSSDGLQSDLTILTENFPPYNYEENGEVKGISVDVLSEIFRRMGRQLAQKDITVTPWARGFAVAQRRKNTLLFSMVKTPERSNLFRWVGPIATSTDAIIARKSARIILDKNNFNAFKYAVIQASPGMQKAIDAGIRRQSLVTINSPDNAAHMLARGRFDGWLYDATVAYWMLHSLGYKVQDFEVIYRLNDSEFYFALNKNSDEALVTEMQNTLKAMGSDGTLAAITNNYIMLSDRRALLYN